jgi:uncharacterized membrane protein
MAILVLGVLLFVGAHLLKPAMPARRAALAAQYGEGPVKGAVALALVLAIAAMAWGYGPAASWGFAYIPPGWGWHLNNLLMLVAFVLLGAGHMKSNIRRVVRHPMLTAVAIWAVAHLLANGDWRSLVLFGGLGLWAVLSMLFINRRDGAFVVPPESPRSKDLMAVAGGVVVFVVVAFLHWKVFGLSPFPTGA